MYESPVILDPKTTEFGTLRVVAELNIHAVSTPDYCGSDGFSEILLGWGGRYDGWTLSWTTCEGHGTCVGAHPIDPDTVRRVANELDDDLLGRWLNMYAADGIKYRVSRVHGYSQGDVWPPIESYPPHYNPSDLPNPEHNEAVNWARGDIYTLVTQRYDEDADMWDDVHYGYDVHGQSWELADMEHVKDYAEECRDNYLSDLVLDQRAKDARDADLVSGMI